MFDPELFGQAMGDAIKSAVAPLQAKIADLEKQLAERPDVAVLVSSEVSKAVAAIPAAKDGKDCDMAAVKALVDEAVKSLPAPKDGKDADPAEIAKMVKAAVDALPKPQDGKSITVEEVRPILDQAIKQLREESDAVIAEPLKLAEAARDQLCKALGELQQPADGKSVTLADVQPVLDEAIHRMQKDVSAAVERVLTESNAAKESVQRAVEAIRQPEDGKSVTVDDVAPLIKAEVEKAVALIPVPKDGAGVAGAMIDRDGNLNLTLTNGEVKNLGRVEGNDGQNGKDGLGFDDLQVEYDGERTVTLKFVRDGIVKEANIQLPVVLDRGVFKEGLTYDAADGVTWGGSYWIAKKATGTRPGEGNDDWRLSVKKGRDGKDGRDGIDFTAPVNLKGEK